MARLMPATTLYLRLPQRSAQLPAEPLQLSLPFAWALRGRLQRADTATLAALSPLLAQAARVVLLLAASDVTLLRLTVPPLPAARLQAALPALVEDRVIGDPEDCAIAAGPEVEGQRTIAIADRAWLQRWLDALRQLGARRIAALPMSLCLPLPAGRVSAALLDLPGAPELAVRTSADEGLGLPIAAGDAAGLLDEVPALLATLTGGSAVRLSVPAAQAGLFHAWSAEHPDSGIEVVDEDWRIWIDGAGQAGVDLAAGVAAAPGERIDWLRWRWPLRLALACLLLNVIALNADWWRLRSEGRALEDEMATIYRRAFPGEPAGQEPLAQMRQKVAAARQAAGEFAAGDFLPLAAALGEAWTEAGNDPRAIAALEYRDATLNVRLRPGAQVSLDAMAAALAARRLSATPSAADPSLWQVRSAP